MFTPSRYVASRRPLSDAQLSRKPFYREFTAREMLGCCLVGCILDDPGLELGTLQNFSLRRLKRDSHIL